MIAREILHQIDRCLITLNFIRRRKKEEGRRKKEEGRRKKEEVSGYWLLVIGSS
jgi:hypothetical protein